MSKHYGYRMVLEYGQWDEVFKYGGKTVPIGDFMPLAWREGGTLRGCDGRERVLILAKKMLKELDDEVERGFV